MTYKPPLLKQLFHTTRRLIAKNWLSHQKALQIAVTGSQGKTITAQTIAKVASTIGGTTVTDVNLDTTYNVPITALKVFRWTKFAVFELGVDHPGEMDLHLQIVKPKIAVVTGISPVHTDEEHLGSLENLIKEKRKLIEALPKDGYAILNWDDENVRKMAPYTKAKILWYGTNKNHCDVWANDVKVSLKGTMFNLHIKPSRFDKTYEDRTSKVETKLIGKHHIYTVMAGYLVSSLISPNLPNLPNILQTISPLPGRMSVEPGPLGTVILNDALRANPASTESGLKTLSDIEYKKGRKIAVLAEMGELQHPEEEHRKIIKILKTLNNINYVITIGNLFPKLPQSSLSPQILWAKNIAEASEILKKIVKKNDLIYLKGSLLRHVERVLLILEGKRLGCTVISCPFYHHCLKCPYLEKGYNKIDEKIS